MEEMKSKYVKSEKEIEEYLAIFKKNTYMDIEAVDVLYETKPEVIAAILPPPLEPVDSSLVMVEFASTAHTNQVYPFNCTGVFIPCKYKELVGQYCVHWVFDIDYGIFQGREHAGEPKKYGKTTFIVQGNHVEGHTVRYDKEYITMVGELEGPADIDKLPKESVLFFIKSFLKCDGSGLEFDPILVKASLKTIYKFAQQGHGEIKYALSDHDFVYELEVVKPLGLLYTSFSLDAPFEPIATIPAKEFLPYHIGRMDDYRLLKYKELGQSPRGSKSGL